jgi:hypothetical protein
MDAFDVARADDTNLILVQDTSDAVLCALESSAFDLERVFENDAHQLLLYSATSSP